MKQLLSVFLGVMLFSSVFAGDTENIINALKQGNVNQLSQYFDDIVDIKLPEKEEIKNVGKNQAEIAIRNFFDANKIKGFTLASQREMGGTMYFAGKIHGVDKNYNITLMMKSKKNLLAIITIRINE